MKWSRFALLWHYANVHSNANSTSWVINFSTLVTIGEFQSVQQINLSWVRSLIQQMPSFAFLGLFRLFKYNCGTPITGWEKQHRRNKLNPQKQNSKKNKPTPTKANENYGSVCGKTLSISAQAARHRLPQHVPGSAPVLHCSTSATTATAAFPDGSGVVHPNRLPTPPPSNQTMQLFKQQQKQAEERWGGNDGEVTVQTGSATNISCQRLPPRRF